MQVDDAKKMIQILSKQRVLIRAARDATPLPVEEQTLFPVIREKFSAHVQKKYGWSEQETNEIWSDLQDMIGRRGIMNLQLDRNELLSIPMTWFIGESVLAALVFVLSQSFLLFPLVFVATHAVLYSYYQKIKKNIRLRQIEQIRQGELRWYYGF